MQPPCSAILVRITSAHTHVCRKQTAVPPPPLIVHAATSNDIQVRNYAPWGQSIVFILRPACVTRTPQHIQQVPGLEGVTAALAVEVPVADGTPYHSLPLPPFATPGSARDPTAPPLLLWVTAEALALLFPPQRIEPDTCAREQGDAGDTALPGQRDENQMGREGTLVLMASLLHVGVAAAARHLHVLQVECWRPPRAVHVEVEGDHAPCAAAWRAALAFMHDAASQWPLKKVRALAIASRYEWEEPQHLTTSVIYQKPLAVPAPTSSR
jgi:hypothetical protein